MGYFDLEGFVSLKTWLGLSSEFSMGGDGRRWYVLCEYKYTAVGMERSVIAVEERF